MNGVASTILITISSFVSVVLFESAAETAWAVWVAWSCVAIAAGTLVLDVVLAVRARRFPRRRGPDGTEPTR